MRLTTDLEHESRETIYTAGWYFLIIRYSIHVSTHVSCSSQFLI